MSRKDSALEPGDRDLLLGGVAGVKLPGHRADALWQRIAAGTQASPVADAAFDIVPAAADDWRPFLPGLKIKPLRVDSVAGTQTSLWRLDAGARVPAHSHDAEEECLILEGTLVWGERRYGAGDYLLAHAGGAHDEFTSPDGALFLIRSQLTEPLRRLFATPRVG
jgi:anti-sigma factor ChrR (cupin superfamily)